MDGFFQIMWHSQNILPLNFLNGFFLKKKKHLERAIVWMYLQPHYDNGILEMFTFQLDNSKNTLGHCFTAKRPEIYFPTFSACFESQYFLQFGFWLF